MSSYSFNVFGHWNANDIEKYQIQLNELQCEYDCLIIKKHVAALLMTDFIPTTKTQRNKLSKLRCKLKKYDKTLEELRQAISLTRVSIPREYSLFGNMGITNYSKSIMDCFH